MRQNRLAVASELLYPEDRGATGGARGRVRRFNFPGFTGTLER
jgi:hypothetical protein